MNLIFICSYMNVMDVIDTVEHEQSDFRILTSDEGLQDFFSKLYSANNVIPLPAFFGSIKYIPHFLRDLVKLPFAQFRILRACKKTSPKNIIFFYTGYNGFESWLIKKLSKKAKVHHRPIVDMALMEPNPSLKNQIQTKLFSLIYQIKFSSMFFMGHPMVVIDNSFLSLVNAQKYNHEFDQQNVVEFLRGRLKVPSRMKVLLLLGPEYHIDLNEYKAVTQNIYTLLLEHYEADQIGIKHHPNFPETDIETHTGTIIFEKTIPGNLLMFSFDLIIGGASSILYQAGNAGRTVISNICMFKSMPDIEMNYAKEYLLSNSKRKDHLFPKDLGELNNLLTRNSQEGVKADV
ncbi:hypothetical protein N9H56_01350 [Pseudomonadales bacterium]|nr:hypothetical protein [Pseudomonadales bacterium]